MTARDDARDVGLLLRYALEHASSPARHDAYARLLDRYQSDPDLRTLFDETGAGLGVRVLAADRTTGLVLTAEPDSPLAVIDTQRWLRIRGVSDRMIYGLALGGIAAWCYPNARSVREPGTRRVTAVDADRLIRDHAAALASREDSGNEVLGAAWVAYTERKQVELTPSGLLKRHCTVKMCEDVLEMLAVFGLVVPDKTILAPRTDLGVWRSTDRFRAHVGTAGGPLVWQTIVSAPTTTERDPDSDEEGDA
jgi:hypothetical protein